MITQKTDLLSAMIEAFMMEKGTNEFYKEASARATGQEAKKAFSELAKWEHDHMNYIQFLYQSINEDREMTSFETFSKLEKADTVEGGIPLDKLRQSFGSVSFDNDIGAIKLAQELEARAFTLYRNLSETVADTNVQVFMKEMMSWELKHIQYIKDLLHSINKAV